MSRPNVIMDFDDFCDETNELESLVKLRQANGLNFKVTLFTIPGKSSLAFLKKTINKYPWIQLAIHGWDHHGVGECLTWSKDDAAKYIKKALAMRVFAPGFKAPNWLASSGTYEACRDLGVWVAEISPHKGKIPKNTLSYILEEPVEDNTIHAHGHITNYPPNYIKSHLSDYIFGRDYNYLFIDTYLRRKNA